MLILGAEAALTRHAARSPGQRGPSAGIQRGTDRSAAIVRRPGGAAAGTGCYHPGVLGAALAAALPADDPDAVADGAKWRPRRPEGLRLLFSSRSSPIGRFRFGGLEGRERDRRP